MQPKTNIKLFMDIPASTISDAVEEITGFRGYMDQKIKPIFPVRIVGYAVTVLNQRASKPKAPLLLMEAIDEANEGDVLVNVFEDAGENASSWGGLLTEGALQKKLAGTITNSPTRDAWEITNKKYPVFSNGTTPSTGGGKYSVVAKNIPVTCGGVTVRPGDLVVGDPDGVVIVPRENVDEVYKVCVKIEADEKEMVKDMQKTGSLLATFKKIERI